MKLPEAFADKMKNILGKEYEAFEAGYDMPRQYGLRVNTLKISTEKFEHIAPFHLTKIPWIENGYYYEEEDAPSRHPYYYAGLYYLQEPSACLLYTSFASQVFKFCGNVFKRIFSG